MEMTAAIDVFGALAQATRLEAFRLIVRHGPAGIAAGDVARHLGVPQNTMSTHLAVLSRAGLVSSERRSRSMIFRADIDRVRDLTSYLVADCCGGRPELCEPLVAEFTLGSIPREKNCAC